MTANRRFKRFFPFILVAVLAVAECAEAGYIYQSATLGPTGQGGGVVVAEDQILGVRFDVTSTVTTGSIGGHFVSDTAAGPYFGAIVALSGPNAFPESNNLTTPDVLGSTLLNFPYLSSADVGANLSLTLTPGWYAVLFGGGTFGSPADASGAAPSDNTDIGTPSFFFSRGLTASGYQDGGFDDVRFWVSTDTIATPEPASMTLFALGAVSLCGVRSFRRRTA